MPAADRTWTWLCDLPGLVGNGRQTMMRGPCVLEAARRVETHRFRRVDINGDRVFYNGTQFVTPVVQKPEKPQICDACYQRELVSNSREEP